MFDEVVVVTIHSSLALLIQKVFVHAASNVTIAQTPCS